MWKRMINNITPYTRVCHCRRNNLQPSIKHHFMDTQKRFHTLTYQTTRNHTHRY
eukprot:m.61070 g.61070  ORF g.61070 m.61070 type:complete len:54 (+) comp17519_c0_seq1:75-236(+)